MRDLIDAMPIVRAVRALRRRPDALGQALITVLLIYVGVSLATPWSTSLQRRLMAAHHLEPASLPSFAMLQLAPKMYGFAHRVWIGRYPLFALPAESAEGRFRVQHFWVNHYPARFARFDGRRGEVFGQPNAVRYVYIRSSYRGLEQSTAFKVTTRDGKLVLERLRGFR